MTSPTLVNRTDLAEEVARRRTFAIISHPDAGKTTLTEKLLLYAGAIDLAGSVRARKHQRRATSDWMELEQQRGISVTATALQFEYRGMRLNLLDTPGHQDFSEDTYRTLMAVDSAVMVLDAAKGIEPQTRKLFEVCRMRALPIITFINKLDQPGRDPLELLDEIERVLGMQAVPLNWPIGGGALFQGVYDHGRRQVLRYERTTHGQHRAPVQVASLDDPMLDDLLDPSATAELREAVALVTTAGGSFDLQAFQAGRLTPVFFGSALHNFGVEPFLSALLELAPPPRSRVSDRGLVRPEDSTFSGFIFKIQANMDPRHRDCMAFLRVCSGRFEKGMLVEHPRLQRQMRLSRPHRLFAQARETVDEAYPGDIVGLLNPGVFAIGDTVCSGPPLRFDAIPRFQPECFARLRSTSAAKSKQLTKGLVQLEQEGAVQVLFTAGGGQQELVLAAVGELQFDVVRARLAAEYNVLVTTEPLPYSCARWVDLNAARLSAMEFPHFGNLRTLDRDNRLILLFETSYQQESFARMNPDVPLRDLP